MRPDGKRRNEEIGATKNIDATTIGKYIFPFYFKSWKVLFDMLFYYPVRILVINNLTVSVGCLLRH